MKNRCRLYCATPAEHKSGLGFLRFWGLLLAAAQFLISDPVIAQVWEYLGMPTGSISAIVVRSNDTVIVSGGGGGAFRTTNGGASWDTLFDETEEFIDLKQHPTNPSILYAADRFAFPPNGVIKSINGGMTWFSAGEGIYIDFETFVQVLAIDPVRPETLYVGTSGFLGGDIYKSTNGGINWNSIGTIKLDGVNMIAIDPASTNTVYAATIRGDALYKSTDAGNSWVKNGIGSSVVDLAFDLADTNLVYASADQFFRSTDDGSTWYPFTSGMPPNTNVASLAVNQLTREVFAIVFPDSVGLFRSTDLGSTWARVDGIEAEFWGSAMTLSPNQTTLYLAVHNSGLYRTSVINEVEADDLEYPNTSKLLQNYPNPFNGTAIVEYEISEVGQVTVELYDQLGRRIQTLVERRMHPGVYRLIMNATGLASGIYYYQLITSSGKRLTRKAVVIR